MAEKPKPGKAGGFKAALTRKIGPLPFWAWAAIGGVGLYLYRRRYGAGSAATSSSGLTTPTGGAAGSGSDLGAPSTGSGGGGSGSPPADTGTPSGFGGEFYGGAPGFYGGVPDTIGAQLTASPGLSPDGAQGGAPAALAQFTRPTAASSPNFAAEAAAKSAAAIAAGATPRFGGVVSTSLLPSGATVTTYATGRKVEQAPGKAAYVIAAGSTGAKTVAKASAPARTVARTTAAPKATKKPVALNPRRFQTRKNVKAG